MKKILSYCWFLCLLSGLLNTSCQTPRAALRLAPEEVAEKFFTALRNQDYDQAKSFATAETARTVGVIQTLSELGGGVNIMRDNKKELISCNIQNDLAVCSYKAFSGPDEKVYLVKLKGKWLVDLKGKEQPEPSTP